MQCPWAALLLGESTSGQDSLSLCTYSICIAVLRVPFYPGFAAFSAAPQHLHCHSSSFPTVRSLIPSKQPGGSTLPLCRPNQTENGHNAWRIWNHLLSHLQKGSQL